MMDYMIRLEGDYVEEELLNVILDKLMEDARLNEYMCTHPDDIKYHKKLLRALKVVKGYISV